MNSQGHQAVETLDCINGGGSCTVSACSDCLVLLCYALTFLNLVYALGSKVH